MVGIWFSIRALRLHLYEIHNCCVQWAQWGPFPAPNADRMWGWPLICVSALLKEPWRSLTRPLYSFLAWYQLLRCISISVFFSFIIRRFSIVANITLCNQTTFQIIYSYNKLCFIGVVMIPGRLIGHFSITKLFYSPHTRYRPWSRLLRTLL